MIGLLGPVTVDGRAVPGVRAQRLLTALALARRPVSSDHLIEQVWGGDTPKSPQAALHTQLSRLRSLVDVVGSDGRYRLGVVVTDLVLAEQALADGDPAAAAAYFRGDPPDEVRADADRLRARIDERRMHDALAAGDHRVAEEIASARAAADPLDETAHVALMRAMAGAGRTAEALAVFARLRRTLAVELGADPGEEAAELNTRLLSGGADTRRSRRRPKTETLIGRDLDVAALTDLLDAHSVVTVQGPGGVGKTSIAQVVGDRLAAGGTSVHVVLLAAVRAEADLIGAVAAALGVGESDVRTSSLPRPFAPDLSERLGDALRGGDTLLILDNCEQVIDACAQLVDSLVGALPDLRVLVTSRSPLLIAAEQVYQLPVLPTTGDDSPGAELFTRRARSVRPDAVLDPAAVADLCGQLDGLPLAIELAAARIRVMSVDEIAAGLTERFALLRSADRTAPDRHRTLEAVIDWSWDLLDDDARVALRRTCLFPNGFTVAAAAAATGMRGAALMDALQALGDQSLLRAYDLDGRTRYRMLEMVREFGEAELVAAGERAEVVAAMSEWARDLCDDVRGRYRQVPDRELVAEVVGDVENLVWVLRQAVDDAPRGDAVETVVTVFPVIAVFWASRGLHAEAAAWAVRVIDALPIPRRDDERLREPWQLTAVVAAAHVLPVGNLRSMARASWMLRRLTRPDRTYLDPVDFLVALLSTRRMPAAYRIVLRGLQPGRPDLVRWAALSIRFNIRENIGDLDGALRDSIEVARLAGRPDSFTAAMTDMTTASLLGQRGQWEQALVLYERTVERFDELGAVDDAQQVGAYIVASLLALGRLDEARERLDDLTDGWKPGDPTPQGGPESLAGMMTVLGEYQRLSGTASNDDIATLLGQSADLLVGAESTERRDPGVIGVVSAAVAGMIRVGALDRAHVYLAELVTPIVEHRSDVGWIDVPQTAGVVFESGVLTCLESPGDEAGARRMALALRLGARHDYPALHELLVDAPLLSGMDADAWTALRAEVDAMPRRRALDEATELLAER